MREEYDFIGAQRAQDVPALAKLQAEAAVGKTRITIFIDADVLAAFRTRAEAEGKSYQLLINEALRSVVQPEQAPVTVETLRRVLREELHAG